MLFISHNTTSKHRLCSYYIFHRWIVQLVTQINDHQPHTIAIKWKPAVFDSIPSAHITNQIQIEMKNAITITIEIEIAIEIKIALKIPTQIIIEVTTTTIQNNVHLCRWIRFWCRLQIDTERWVLLFCKELSNQLLIWYAFIKLIHLFLMEYRYH